MLNNLVDIEGIERCTIAAVAPQQVHELAGWLLPMDSGSIGRAHSAVPLSHAASNADPALISAIISQYVNHGMQAKFRLPDVPAFAPFIAKLHTLGYCSASPTWVQTTTSTALRDVAALASAAYLVEQANEADKGWVQVFSKGREPTNDDLARVNNFRRGTGVVFAGVRDADAQGVAVSAGAAAFSHGWACVHGLNTLAAYRRRGMGTSVLAALARVALVRDVQRIMLQVEEDNTSAQALYRRLGFTNAWKYVYWQLP